MKPRKRNRETEREIDRLEGAKDVVRVGHVDRKGLEGTGGVDRMEVDKALS